ncbi:MAG: sigma-70 family RNA polymerase sigma factor [Planctomycetota bacterium]
MSPTPGRSPGSVDLPGLVRDALAGDESAWSRLVDRFGPQIVEVARSMRLSDADVDEAFQATWVCVLRDLPYLRDPGALGGWIFVTARRQCWRLKRRRGDSAPGEQEMAAVPGGPDADPAVASAVIERRRLVRDAIGELSERCQRLLRELFFARGSSRYDDVSERLGIPRGSIGPQRERCLAGLARILERRGFPEPPGPEDGA